MSSVPDSESGEHAFEFLHPGKRLAEIADQLKSGGTPVPVTVRTFLSWFGVQRRGYYKILMIRKALQEAGLATVPPFEFEYIDSTITFTLNASDVASDNAVHAQDGTAKPGSGDSMDAGEPDITSAQRSSASTDPTYRIGKLAAANNTPVRVKPDSSLSEVVTLMLSNDFSQLPVMQSDHTVKGVVSWASIGSRLALGRSGAKASDFMEPAREISAETSLFAAIDSIVSGQYVLIRGSDNRINGIVTPSDLSIQFGQLAEPFLLLGEIENHVRRLIGDRFTAEEVRSARDPNDDARQVNSVIDLSFGEYVRLLSSPESWKKMCLEVDRGTFVEQLDRIREIRNDVMHFDPDGVSPQDMSTLRKFSKFLMTLQELGAT